MKTKSEIFKAAHKMAKTFEGDYIARFVLALSIVRNSKLSITEEITEKLNQKIAMYKLSGMNIRGKMIQIANELRKEFYAELKNEIGQQNTIEYFRNIANL